MDAEAILFLGHVGKLQIGGRQQCSELGEETVLTVSCCGLGYRKGAESEAVTEGRFE